MYIHLWMNNVLVYMNKVNILCYCDYIWKHFVCLFELQVIIRGTKIMSIKKSMNGRGQWQT